MKTEIESLWYQRKITGYGANGPFPTEMTVVFTVGDKFSFPNNRYGEVVEIKQLFSVEEAYEIRFKDGRSLSISGRLNPDILYKSPDNGDTKKEDK